MATVKMARIQITRHTPIEGNRREVYHVDKKHLHNWEEFTAWFEENKNSLPDRILKSDSRILDRFVEERANNIGDSERRIWEEVIDEVCGSVYDQEDEVEDSNDGEVEVYSSDQTYYKYQPDVLVTESDTEPEPEPEPIVVPEPEPIVVPDIDESYEHRVQLTELGEERLLQYIARRWQGTGYSIMTAYDRSCVVHMVNAVLKSKELWTSIEHLIDCKAQDMGWTQTGAL